MGTCSPNLTPKDPPGCPTSQCSQTFFQTLLQKPSVAPNFNSVPHRAPSAPTQLPYGAAVSTEPVPGQPGSEALSPLLHPATWPSHVAAVSAAMTSPLESPHTSLPGPQPFLSLQDEWALLDLPAGSDSLLPLCTLHHPKVRPCVPGLPQAQPLPELVEFSGQGLTAWPQAWPHP